jgi:hypothetical protein
MEGSYAIVIQRLHLFAEQQAVLTILFFTPHGKPGIAGQATYIFQSNAAVGENV